jgi:lipopolysaccharide assembly outer membrane protein LptD (OstA)
LIKIFFIFFIFFIYCINIFASNVIIPDEIISFNNNLKNYKCEIIADKITYNKKQKIFFAYNNVLLIFKNYDNDKNFEIHSDFVTYDIHSKIGKIFGDNVFIKHYKNDMTKIFTLKAKEVYLDINKNIFKAYDNVEIETLTCIIYSSNCICDLKTFDIFFKSEKKRPIVNICLYDKKMMYEADEIIFYNNKDIEMKGSVFCKINGV